MVVTDVRVKVLENDEKLKAVASITFDGVFVVHDIKIINGTAGLFVAMPSRKGRDGTFKDVAHPIVTEFREMIAKSVLEAYEKALTE
ncbi:MAG: septation regulator SpoVG [Eubacteriales bacterium]|nr:septation regulator SpoVG [Eubacteriales bacterium]